MFFETVQVILATGVVLLLFHHRKHLSNLIWRPYVLLFFGLCAVLQLQNTSKLLCFVAWLFFVCLHHFKDLQKGNESNCPLCLEDLKTSFPYECTRCKKATHAKCAVEYMERSGEGSFRCPVCHKDQADGVKKEELILEIEQFEQLMGEEHSERLKSETAENPPTTTRTTASKKSHGKLLSHLKEIAFVSIMVIFYGSYQLFHDSYRALPEDMKNFAGDAIQFVKSFAQKMNGVAWKVFNYIFIEEGTIMKNISVLFSSICRTIQKLVEDAFFAVWHSRIAELVKQKTPEALFALGFYLIASLLAILYFAFKTLPTRVWHILSEYTRKVIIAVWQFLRNALKALSNVYYNVLVSLAKLLYRIICEALYNIVTFLLKTVSLCRDLYVWLRIKVPELFTVIWLHLQQLWSYTCFVLRQWWTMILHSRAWSVVVTVYEAIHKLLVVVKRTDVVCFCVRVAKQLSGAIVRKMSKLLLTSKDAFANTIMHSHVVEHMIVPSVMYAGDKVRELAQSSAQYVHIYGPRVRESMLDAMWSAYYYDYNDVMYVWIESFRGTMRRVLYRDRE